ncbi:hypothetical protein NE237_000496 [Protea cynaroides]|uniref:Uncharacterized protein n=1 Tax=Protea cynaroides TaxID=273540 RepID=A0A9Q0QXJ2_9MAGN|nr:hypothetical protein NE237_000496 [Protea cynaroides]
MLIRKLTSQSLVDNRLRWWQPPAMLQRMWCLLRMSVSSRARPIGDLVLPCRSPPVLRTSSGRIVNMFLLSPQPIQPSSHVSTYATLIFPSPSSIYVPSSFRIVPPTLSPAPPVPFLFQYINSSPLCPLLVIQHLETACCFANLYSTVKDSSVFSPLAGQGPCGSPKQFRTSGPDVDVVETISNPTPVLPIVTSIGLCGSLYCGPFSSGRPPAISNSALPNSVSLRPALHIRTRTSPRFSASTGQSYKLPPIGRPLPLIIESSDVDSNAMTNEVDMVEDPPSTTDPWYL